MDKVYVVVSNILDGFGCPTGKVEHVSAWRGRGQAAQAVKRLNAQEPRFCKYSWHEVNLID